MRFNLLCPSEALVKDGSRGACLPAGRELAGMAKQQTRQS